jgi:threonine dehydratase
MAVDAASLPDRAALDEARRLLAGVIAPTPCLPAIALTEELGRPVLLKCENLQRTGSFKVRGAYVRLAKLSAAERRRGVVAASAGNHAQGVALAASLLGIDATVFMPVNASLPKVVATSRYGAQVELAGDSVADAIAMAIAYGERTGAVVVHPYDHQDVVAGQASVGLEILEQVPDVGTIVVPAGGGGLLAGIAVAVRAHRPDVRVVGVQSTAVPSVIASLEAGHPVDVAHRATIADGIAVTRAGDVPFAAIADSVDRVVAVDDEQLALGVVHCLERYKLVAEPAGAAGVAALLQTPDWLAGDAPVVGVISGGNVDPLLLDRIVRAGLVSAGRFLQLSLLLPDEPGSLAALLAQVARSGANIVAVEHHRLTPTLEVGQVEVSLQLELRGQDHGAAVIADLVESGYLSD